MSKESETMAKGIDRKSDPVLVGLVGRLKEAGRTNAAPIWRDIASRLEKPARSMAQVNVSKLEAHVREGENAVIAGKLLGSGDLNRPFTVIAWKASASAREKIAKAGGTVLTLEEGVKRFPKGEMCRILG
jgi:large subunit ribosomal protein L18e